MRRATNHFGITPSPPSPPSPPSAASPPSPPSAASCSESISQPKVSAGCRCRSLSIRQRHVDALAEVDGNPQSGTPAQRVGLEEHQFERLRVTAWAWAGERCSCHQPTVSQCGWCLSTGTDMRIVRRMPRLQGYLPDDLHDELKKRGPPASELLQIALRAELERQDAARRDGPLSRRARGRGGRTEHATAIAGRRHRTTHS